MPALLAGKSRRWRDGIGVDVEISLPTSPACSRIRAIYVGMKHSEAWRDIGLNADKLVPYDGPVGK